VSVSATHEFDRVEIGRPFKLKVRVFNNGPGTAFGLNLTDNTPTFMTFVSVTAPGGSSCSNPAVGSSGPVQCFLPPLSSGTGHNVVIRVRPTRTGLHPNMPSVSVSGSDPNPVNNSANDPIDVVSNSRGCTIVGTLQNDVITGTAEEDVICGLRGNDQIDGGAANDVLYGERGSDTITDHDGNDELRGGDGPDTLDSADGVAGDLAHGGFRVDSCTTDAGDTVISCP